MTFRTALSLFAALLAVVAIFILVVLHMSREKVVNIADWDSRSRTLQLAAPEPKCGCIEMSPRDRSSLSIKAVYYWDRAKSLRFGSDPMPDAKDIALVGRDNRSGALTGTMKLGEPNASGAWGFAFDWAGESLGSYYAVQAFPMKAGKVDYSTGPLDMNALFWMKALTQACNDWRIDECSWGDLQMHHAVGGPVGQNAIETSFTGVRLARDNMVIEAQATGKYRGARGNCGCMVVEVQRVPVTLSAGMNGASMGQLNFTQPGVVSIPFDYAGPMGSDFYELRVNSGDERVSNYVRLVSHFDGMACGPTAATLATNYGAGQSSTPPLVSCPYEMANPEKGVFGAMNLLRATNAFPAPTAPKAPATAPPVAAPPVAAPPATAPPATAPPAATPPAATPPAAAKPRRGQP